MLVRAIEFTPKPADAEAMARGDATYPLSLPWLRAFARLDLDAPVTIFVGDNGSGKTTLLNAIAAAAGLPTIGRDASSAARSLPLRLIRSVPLKRGCHFRADQVGEFLAATSRAMAELDTITEEFADIEGDWGRQRAQGVARAERAALSSRYGEAPQSHSHGEIYLRLLRERITGKGLYVLDEPEAPLSPTNQIALIQLLLDAVAERDCQFVIATHSPILMACPGATLIDCGSTPPQPIAWEDTEHVSLTRAFLNNPQAFLRHLDHTP
ncbi:MAG: AAA family ATPase [Pseudomonadota bacterium]